MLSTPQEIIYYSTKERNLFMGGVGSGKTHEAAFVIAKYVVNFPEVLGLLATNTHEQLNKSTLKRVFDVWRADMRWIEGIHYVVDKQPPSSFEFIHSKLKSYSNVISFNNGAMIFVSSLENYSAIDGIEIGYACLDETKDTREEAVKEVIVARLRQKGMYVDSDGVLNSTKGKSFNPLYIFTSPAKVDWINEWFGLSDDYEGISSKIFSEVEFYHNENDRQCVVISSTYHNIANLPDGYIEGLRADYKGNSHLIDMLIYGSPIAKSEKDFYHQFDRLKHVCRPEYNPSLPLHLSFDFNVLPYMTALACQIEEVDGVWFFRVLKEFAMKPPKNNTEDTCKEILLNYPNADAWYYGDASGKNRTTVSKDMKHNYAVIDKILSPILVSEPSKVPKANPPLVQRGDFMNHLFAGGKNFKFEIHEDCKTLIADLEFCQISPSGGKLKKKVNGVEKYGHFGDCIEYIVHASFWEYFNSSGNSRFIGEKS